MPYQDDGLITDFDVTIVAGPAYDLSTIALDLNRPLTTQVMVLFYFTAFTDGTTVSSQTWTNWYDPYLVPDANLTFNEGTQVVTLDVTSLGTATTASGTVLTRPLFSTGTKVRLMRAQDITNIAHTFAAGSRVTSTALNNSVGQIFKSMQEVEDRLVKVEGAAFEDGVTLNSDDFPVIPVLKGGTGATTAGAARTALGADSATNLTTGTIPNARITGLPKGNILAAADDIINKTVGTSANNVVALDGAAKLPAVDGSALTNLPSAPTFGIANTNAVKVDSTSVADDEYARFTANGLESRATSEVLSDIGAAAASHNHAAGDITSGTLAVARGGTGLTSVSTLLNSNTTKSDVGLGSVENTALSTFTGTSNITTVGTISTGVWGGTAIAYSALSGKPVLGTAAALNVGTSANNIVQLSGLGSMPAVSGSALTGLNASNFTSGTLAVARGGTGSATAPMVGVVTAADAAAARTVLGLGTAATSATGDFSPVAGSGSIVTTGTIASGTWNATAIEDTKLDLRVDHGVTFDGQGSVIETAKTVYVPVERNGVIKSATLVGDASGSATITVTKYDPAADDITLGSPAAVGSIALATKMINRDTTLSGWTTAVSEGDILAFTTGGSLATITRLTCKLKMELA